MSDLLSPIVAGAGLSFSVLLVLAVANGMSALVFGQTVEGFVNARVGGAE